LYWLIAIDTSMVLTFKIVVFRIHKCEPINAYTVYSGLKCSNSNVVPQYHFNRRRLVGGRLCEASIKSKPCMGSTARPRGSTVAMSSVLTPTSFRRWHLRVLPCDPVRRRRRHLYAHVPNGLLFLVLAAAAGTAPCTSSSRRLRR
jgi:hypothetical protein